jgi:translation initiation factor 1
MSRLFEGTPFDRPVLCPRCGKAPADCRCLSLPEKKKMSEGKRRGAGAALDSGLVLTPANSRGPADQVARVRVERRKGNRLVSVISGLEHPGNDLAGLCTTLKTTLGTGGSVQGRTIEIQGDHGARIVELLAGRGLRGRVL